MGYLLGHVVGGDGGWCRPSITSLTRRAKALSASWGGVGTSSFAFDSMYAKGKEQRGWSNWLLSQRLMLGQYPHMQPAVPGPSADDAQIHLQRVLAAGVDCFACLQAELPPQDSSALWPKAGVQLPSPEDRAKWPNPFVRYAPEADALASEMGRELTYLYCPIDDLSLPRDGLSEGP